MRPPGLPKVVLAGIPVLLALVATPILLLTVVHGPVDATRLDRSVAGAAGRLTLEDCRPAGGPRHWSCGVWIDEGRFSSGGVAYDVHLRPGSSCWTGRLDPAEAAEAGVPATLDGCVRRWQLAL